MEHTFAICAYKKSPYLEKCIRSLRKQTISSDIIIVTSTPNEYISDIALRYDIPLYIRDGASDIAADWNYAYSKADTPYVTITHQDDIYLPKYAESLLSRMRSMPDALIGFTDYTEIRDNKNSTGGFNHLVKSALLLPIRNMKCNGQRWRKRWIIRFGNAICCPSVMYHKAILTQQLQDSDGVIFKSHFRSNLDWEAWERMSRLPGRFVYVHNVLIAHRIHDGSETSAVISENKRGAEDYTMFTRFWPKTVSKAIAYLYSNSEKSNNI